jgi:hypothetical protein
MGLAHGQETGMGRPNMVAKNSQMAALPHRPSISPCLGLRPPEGFNQLRVAKPD